MKKETPEKEIAALLKVLGSAIRIRILFAIGHGEACVCHLESVLKKRQAYISQHLMVLRDAGLLEPRREGKYIFYRVSDRRIFDMIRSAAAVRAIGAIPELVEENVQQNCSCPKCSPEPGEPCC